jgi:hypothetical protein
MFRRSSPGGPTLRQILHRHSDFIACARQAHCGRRDPAGPLNRQIAAGRRCA